MGDCVPPPPPVPVAGALAVTLRDATFPVPLGDTVALALKEEYQAWEGVSVALLVCVGEAVGVVPGAGLAVPPGASVELADAEAQEEGERAAVALAHCEE